MTSSNTWCRHRSIALATAAHQGWSANLFTTVSDSSPAARWAAWSAASAASPAASAAPCSLAKVGFIINTGGYVPLFAICGLRLHASPWVADADSSSPKFKTDQARGPCSAGRCLLLVLCLTAGDGRGRGGAVERYQPRQPAEWYAGDRGPGHRRPACVQYQSPAGRVDQEHRHDPAAVGRVPGRPARRPSRAPTIDNGATTTPGAGTSRTGPHGDRTTRNVARGLRARLRLPAGRAIPQRAAGRSIFPLQAGLLHPHHL